MATTTNNDVEQIKIDVAKDVAAGNLTQKAADSVVARAEEIAANPVETPTAEPTPTSSVETNRLASAGITSTDTGDGLNIVVEGISIGTGSSSNSGAAGVVELALIQQGVPIERIREVVAALRSSATESSGSPAEPATSTPASNALEQIKAALSGSVNVNIDRSVLEAANVDDSQIDSFLAEQSDVRAINQARDQVNQALAAGATVSRSVLKAAALKEPEIKRILDQQAA